MAGSAPSQGTGQGQDPGPENGPIASYVGGPRLRGDRGGASHRGAALSVESHREGFQAMDERARAPAQRLWGYRQRHGSEPLQQRAERDLGLQPGQRSAQAVVDAVTERQVPRAVPADVQPLGVGVAEI